MVEYAHSQTGWAPIRCSMFDFLVAAHALRHADRLLTRDRGFYRRAFSDLVVLGS